MLRASNVPSASSRTMLIPAQVETKERIRTAIKMDATATATSTSISAKPASPRRRKCLTLAVWRNDIDEPGEPVDAHAPVQTAARKSDDGAAGAAIGAEHDRKLIARRPA